MKVKNIEINIYKDTQVLIFLKMLSIIISNFLSTYDKMCLKLVRIKLFKKYKRKELQELNNKTLEELIKH